MLLAASFGGVKAYFDYRLRTELDTRTQKAANYVAVSYEQANTSLTGAIHIDEIQLTTLPIRITTLTLHQAYRFYDPAILPKRIHVTAHAVNIPLSENATATPTLLTLFGYAPYYISPKDLRDLGYPAILAEIETTLTQTADNEMQGVIIVVMPTLGQLQFTFTLKNVPAPAKWPAALMSVELVGLEIHYTDNGFVKRVVSWLAQRKQVTSDNLVQTFVTKLQMDMNRIGLKVDASAFTSLQKFLQTPDTLVVRCQPPTPLTLSALPRLTTVTFVERLGLTIK